MIFNEQSCSEKFHNAVLNKLWSVKWKHKLTFTLHNVYVEIHIQLHFHKVQVFRLILKFAGTTNRLYKLII